MGDLGLGWGGLVDWGSGLVGWGGVVGLGLVLGVDSGALVLDVSDVAVVVVGGGGRTLPWALVGRQRFPHRRRQRRSLPRGRRGR